ncbi:MAG: type II toxin-antitoxin system prevent-host-death family antitoxin [Methanoregulaceae archaeon]|nr:type II toxin-antitoxin system prevent-host-death family antitoxin [Methanoregulaceae archaeon]
MKTVGTYEAKTHLAALLDEVAQGETIIITRHGHPLAVLSPYAQEPETVSVAEAVAGLRELRAKYRVNPGEIKEMIEEGRK